MNVVFIIPTGLGCAIGGHAGDATPAAKIIAQCCDKIILHPNVVNASDINEMPANALYVEGSILDRFLQGKIELQEVASNRVMVVVSAPLKPITINAVNAARGTIGLNTEIVELRKPFIMKGWVENGKAVGESEGVEDLIKQVSKYKYDALAIASPIEVGKGVAMEYFKISGPCVNPWGGIEAIISKQIANAINKPVAHAPIDCSYEESEEEFQLPYTTIVDKRKAAEVISCCYLHCVLKGLHKAPRIGRGINRSSVSCLVSPVGCIGPPHEACFDAGIPIIAVKENTTAHKLYDERITYVENYLEAAGIISCMNAGVFPDSVRSDGL